MIHTEDTELWTVFRDSAPIALGHVAAGRHTLSLRLDATDNYGVDSDWLEFVLAP